MAELVGLLKNLAQELPQLSAAKSVEALDDFLDRCEKPERVDGGEEAKGKPRPARAAALAPDVCKALVNFALSILCARCEANRKLQAKVLELLKIAGLNTRCFDSKDAKDEMQTFFFKLARKEVKTQRVWKPRVMTFLLQNILRWVQVSCADTSALDAASDAVGTLLTALYAEMSRCDRWAPRWRLKTTRALRRVLRAIPQAKTHALAAAQKEEAPALLVAAVTAECGKDALKPLVEAYMKTVIEAKKPPSAFLLDAWGPVLAALSEEELDKQVLPSASRMMKRSPAAIMEAFPAMVPKLSIDLSGKAKEYLDIMAVELLKQQDKRPAARLFVRSVASKSVADAAKAFAVLDNWAEAIKKTVKADEKQALLIAIAEFVSAVPNVDSAVGKAALEKLGDAKGTLAKMAADDANEDTKVFATKALGAILLRLPADAQAPIAQELVKPLDDKKKATDRVRIAALECLAAAVPAQGAAAAPWAGAALDKAVPVCTMAVTKPVQRYQSVVAWSLVTSLAATAKDDVNSRMKKDQMNVLKDKGSFMNIVGLMLKANCSELTAQANSWRAVLRGEIAGLPSLTGAAGDLLTPGADGPKGLPACSFEDILPFVRTGLVLLAKLHEVHAEAGEGKRATHDPALAAAKPLQAVGLQDAVKALPEAEAQALLLIMAHGLLGWIAELNNYLPSARKVSGEGLRGALFDICHAATVLPGALKGETAGVLLLVAQHPLVTTGKWTSKKMWDYLRTTGPLSAVLKSAPKPVWAAACQLVVAGRLLPVSDNTGIRSACLRLASTMDAGEADTDEAASAVKSAVAQLIAQSVQSMHGEEVAKESDRSVLIYFAQEGRLWKEEGTYEAEEVAAKNLKQNKYLKSLGYEDDMVVEKRPAAKAASASKAKAKAGGKAKAGAAPTKDAGQMTKEQINAAETQEQSETRARIRLIVDESHYALAILTILARAEANVLVLEESMPKLVPQFMCLLKSPLTVLKARKTMRSIVCKVVSEGHVRSRELLPDALMVVAKGWQLRTPSAAGTFGDRPVCESLLDSVVSRPGWAMPTAALLCVLPVVLKTLATGLPALAKVCGLALPVLEHQLLNGAELPECAVPEVFDSLHTALLMLTSQRPAVQATLKAATKTLVSTEEHLARVSSMFFNEEEPVRVAVIAAMAEMQRNEEVLNGSLDPTTTMHAVLRLGSLDECTKEVSADTLEGLGFEADNDVLMHLIDYAKTKTSLGTQIQELIAKAVAEVLQELADEDMTNSALDLLMQLFREDAASRITVARCLSCMLSSCLDGETQVVKAFRFLLRQALGLTTSETEDAITLRDKLLDAGIGLIEKHGEEHAEALYAAVEDFEDSAAGAAAGESAKLGVAVFLGALSKHLGASHPKVPEILPRLHQRLLDNTSSTSVQNAIVKVLPPLMKANKEQATEMLTEMLDTALEKKTHEVTRRGAAMGLGAAVKGLGIQVLTAQGVNDRIKEAAEHKKDATTRQGALMCLEGLTLSLGRLFDPYVVSSLPLLLQAFSDSSKPVQGSALTAARAMMSQLSGPGVKQVLKPLLEGIKDKQWRTKLGSIELLASMTNCLPKQLAACLPQVVPALCLVINDQHNKVKEAARDALDRIGSIITSPELRALAPELIEALTDGAQFEHITKRVLNQLLSTSFVHHIDAPSLSLVCPLVQRALKERTAEMKRKGAQIVGSMVLLIKDPKDIQPYLPILLPCLKETLLDPIPDVRATAAKAFGTLANGLPEDMLGDTMPWLFETLRSSESQVERSGAAHGLSEVLMAMGTERIEMLLPDILQNATDKDKPSETKEGYIGLFVYLPVAMGNAFEPYITEVMTALMRSLSDDVSSVREIALRAMQVLTKHFGATHTTLLLQPMEEGVFDADWRIRHASVQLMGQLIEQILRAHRMPTQSAELMSVEVIPREWRTHMLASLYIVRSDENPIVKQACAQVWKAVVQNTPKVLKELLSDLMRLLIQNLASTIREKQRVAARCVGDLVGKLGERVMPELMPIFMNTLAEGDAHEREGVCIGLAELINATTKQLLSDYLGELIPAIRQAIIDDEERVRNEASEVIALLHSGVGSRATNDVVNWVLAALQDADQDPEEGELYVAGLEQLVSKQPGAVIPLIVEKLTEAGEGGYTGLQVKGLCTIAVCHDSHTVHRHLSDILPVCIKVAADSDSDEDLKEAAVSSAVRVMDSVDQNGLNMLFCELCDAVNAEDAGRRTAGAKLFERFFDNTSLDVVPVLPMVFPAILPVALADEDDEAVSAGIGAVNGIVKAVTQKEALLPYLGEVRNAVLKLIIDKETSKEDFTVMLPGLCNHNGLEPIYPIYQLGLQHGTTEVRELAAKGLRELVDHTSEKALEPYVRKITGPLIRIVGDRFPSSLKEAIVDTLKALLLRGGTTLKPFLPQLQTTYVKCLADPSEAVRVRAAASLGVLVRSSARTEPLINELTTGMSSNPDAAVRLAMAIALGEVLLNVTAAASEAVQEKLQDALVPIVLEEDAAGIPDSDRQAAAWALALLIRRHLPADKADLVIQGSVMPALTAGQGEQRHGAAWTLAGICWCQEPQMPVPAQEMLNLLKSTVEGAVSKLAGDGEAPVQAASAGVVAGAARLFAEASLPFAPIEPAADKLAAYLSTGKDRDARRDVASLRAVRHYGMAAGSAKAASQATLAQLAIACSTRGLDKKEEVAEAAEKALSAILLSAVDAPSEDAAKKALERLVGAATDKAAAKLLTDYASKRLRIFVQHANSTASNMGFGLEVGGNI
eukprot:TRINITY_DN47277_c0_g2_i1.p1 TRINITY_DN47277_c0_g2~~TRINITY_DN47277_c0_g2_i1.p1  ORF type:complete len:2755 (+),score=912.30 TRINITY_DN47277_c0_g2_i1:113-8377(+)